MGMCPGGIYLGYWGRHWEGGVQGKMAQKRREQPREEETGGRVIVQKLIMEGALQGKGGTGDSSKTNHRRRGIVQKLITEGGCRARVVKGGTSSKTDHQGRGQNGRQS